MTISNAVVPTNSPSAIRLPSWRSGGASAKFIDKKPINDVIVINTIGFAFKSTAICAAERRQH